MVGIFVRRNRMIGFIVGLFIGGAIGVFTMALIVGGTAGSEY